MDRKLVVAAFTAHPDDFEALIGGTMAKYRQQGHDVHSIVATNGRLGGHDNTGTALVEIRKQEAIAAAVRIGIEPVFLDAEDSYLSDDDTIAGKINAIIKKIKPDVVFTLSPQDYHADHRAISRIVTDKSWAPVFFADTLLGVSFDPQFYVDISGQIETKIAMCREHVSQNPAVIVEYMIEIQNRFRGAQCGGPNRIKYAEAFRLHPVCGAVASYGLLP